MIPDLTDSHVTCTSVILFFLFYPYIYRLYVQYVCTYIYMGPKGQANYRVCKAECLTTLKSFLANKADHFQVNLLNEVALETPNHTTNTTSYWLSLGLEYRIKSLIETDLFFFFLLVLCLLSFCSRVYLTQTMFLLSFSVCGEGMIHLFFLGANYRDNLL